VSVVVADQGRVLAVREGDGWALPGWDVDGGVDWTTVAGVNARATTLLGAPATTLRCLRAERTEGGARSVVFELEVHGPVRLDGGEWVEPGRVDATAVLAETGVEAPWRRKGWFEEASRWIAAELKADGRKPTGAVEQLRTWSISTVLRVPTATGDVYFKAVPPVFCAEPPLTSELARRHPGHVPTVVALDHDRHWMLTDDFGGTALEEVDDGDAWDRALRTYAELQLAWSDRLEDLRALGCPDRSLRALEAEIEPALADVDSMKTGRKALTHDELAALPRLARRLRETCAEVRALGVPASLEHGDLHAGNISIRNGRPLFFDWTDGCVAPPFLSLVPLFGWRTLSHPQERLRDAYLAPWREALGSKVVERAYDLSPCSATSITSSATDA
jgi:hypothetical protein